MKYRLLDIVIGIAILSSAGCIAHARQFAIQCAHDCAVTYGLVDGEPFTCKAKCFLMDCTGMCVMPPGHPYKNGFPVQRK